MEFATVLRFFYNINIMKKYILFIILGFISISNITDAHEGYHPQPHPLNSPNYHEINTVEDIPTISSNADELRTSLIKQIIELLTYLIQRQQGENTNTVTNTVSNEIKSDIVSARGNLMLTIDDNYRYFRANSLPDHTMIGGNYAHTATAQNINFKTLRFPKLNSNPTYYSIPWTFGIAINGVAFEPFAAEWWNNERNGDWQEDPFVTLRGFDISNAHVQPSGLYHYHGLPTQLMDGHNSSTHSPIIGYAADGFPVYYLYISENPSNINNSIIRAESSWQLKSGTRPDGPRGRYDGTYNEDYEYVPGSGDLDECNGRYGSTLEYPSGTYYYVLTEEFPYIPRCLMANPDPSFSTMR